jgi:signal transduction histidine kinase
VTGVGWYRFVAPLSGERTGLWAVYLPSVSRDATVFVNGLRVAGGARPRIHSWNRPLYFPFASDLLSTGDNEILVRLVAYGSAGEGLAPIELGPDSALAGHWRTRTWRQVRVAQFSSVLALGMVVLFSAIWLGKSRDPVYGYFALAAACWGVNSLDYHLHDIAIPFWTWRWLVHAALHLTAVFFVFSVLRLLGLHRPRPERLLLAFAALATIVLAFLRPPVLEPRAYVNATNALHAFSVTFAGSCLYLLLRHWRRLPRRELIVYAIAGVVMNVIILRDFMVRLGVLPEGTTRIFQFAAPLMFLAFGTALLMRFIDAFRRAEESSRELEVRVREKEADLERHFQRMRDLEHRQILSEERERLMREMHDGMGGQLVSTLAMVEAGSEKSEVSDSLRASLDEMRIVIDSLDPVVDDLEGLLAVARERLERRWRRRDVDFEWSIGSLPPSRNFGPEQYLHVLRILEEAITNAVTHGDAKLIQVSGEVCEGPDGKEGVAIAVSDDGTGVAPDQHGGRGLDNMSWRAARLEGRLRIEALPRGTQVVLWFPVVREHTGQSIPAA